MISKFFSIIWNLSEFLDIGLGRFAPFVFEKMIGSKGNKVVYIHHAKKRLEDALRKWKNK